ncbi:MAG: acyl carrier protein [Armatimonadota bacterium]|nr:acyl carrier protein [Armatimonadota bacterium]
MAVADRVKAIVAEEFEVPETQVTDSATFEGDLEGDSLLMMELLMALEDEFDMEIPEEEAQDIQTVGDAVRYIEERTGR